MTKMSIPAAAHDATRPGSRRVFGVRARYWRIGLISGGIYALILMALILRRHPDEPGRMVGGFLAGALFGAVMAAMFGYFEKKALARLDIDHDTAFDLNVFRPAQSRTVMVDGRREDVLQRACDALVEYGAVIDKRDDAAMCIEAVTFQNWRSYGERLTISIGGESPCEVVIRSVPRVYLLKSITNYGRSWEHVQALAARLATGAFPVLAPCGEPRVIVSGDAANTPPVVMEAGAWQRLLALTMLYSLMLLGLSRPGKAWVVVAGFSLGLGLECIAYLRFRKQVQNKSRSESQETVEAMLNNVWPTVFAPILMMDPRMNWTEGNNIAALALVAIFSMIAINRFREKKREHAQRAAIQAGREKAELERQLAEARLVALSAQIEPHFLFNTLASIQYLIRHDAGKAAEMTGDLIRYLRLALPQMKRATAPLAEELEMVRAYLGIMQIRMGSRLRFKIDSGGRFAETQVPTMALITLVENAIKHGLEQKSDGGEITVTVDKDTGNGDRLRLDVTDTGGGFSSAASGTGIGLVNIRERLNTLYGDRASLELEANEPSGVKAILSLPIER